MSAENDGKLIVLFRTELPNADVVEYVVWDNAPGGAVRINGEVQSTDGDPLEAFLRLRKAGGGGGGDGKA